MSANNKALGIKVCLGTDTFPEDMIAEMRIAGAHNQENALAVKNLDV